MSRTKREAVLHLGRLGWSLRRIQRELGVRRETASKYLKEAGVALRRPGHGGHPARVSGNPEAPSLKTGQGVSPDPGCPPANPARGVSPDSQAAPESGQEVSTDPKSQSLCEPWRDFIERSLHLGRDAKVIWQDLVDDHGFLGRYASVKRFARRIRGKTSPRVHPIIETEPGLEGQVDYGEGPLVRCPATGKYRRSRLFLLTLGYSRKSVGLLVWKSGTQVWAELHERAVRKLGGSPNLYVLDNLKEGVLKPEFYDPDLNPVYKALLAHYGARALPCRVADPNRKGKVEAGIKLTQNKLRGLRFERLDAAQAYLDRWLVRWADTRIHGRTKRQVGVMFEEERPHLLPLPLEPFRYFQFGTRKVHRDGCVEVAAAYYSAPPGRIGDELHVQWDDRVVRLLEPRSGVLLCEHHRLPRGRHRYLSGHEPSRTAPSITRLLERARRAGLSIGKVAQAILDLDGPAGIRRIQGLLGLAKKHGSARLDDACGFALEHALPTYRFVRNYLNRRDRPEVALDKAHSLLRELDAYRVLLDEIVETQAKGTP